MESIPPIRSAERRLILVDQLAMASLHSVTVYSEDGMRISETFYDVLGTNSTFIIQRYAEHVIRPNRLKQVHVIGHCSVGPLLFRVEVISASPRAVVFWQNIVLCVKNCGVWLVGESRKNYN